jgi:hypothetical protein
MRKVGGLYEWYALGCCEKAYKESSVIYDFDDHVWRIAHNEEVNKSEAVNFCPFCGKKLLQDQRE